MPSKKGKWDQSLLRSERAKRESLNCLRSIPSEVIEMFDIRHETVDIMPTLKRMTIVVDYRVEDNETDMS